MMLNLPMQDLKKRGLDDEDINALAQMALKYKTVTGELYTSLTEEEHIEIQCEPAQYAEEALDLFMSNVIRQ